MNWLKKLFGAGSKKKSSSRSKSRKKNKNKSTSRSKPKSKSRPIRRKSSAATAKKTSKGRARNATAEKAKSGRRKAVKQESGQTFSNAFNLAKRDLPGIREADAAFGPQMRRTVEAVDDEVLSDEPVPVSLGQAGSGRSPGIRRPN